MPNTDTTVAANPPAAVGATVDSIVSPGTTGQVIKHDGTDWSPGTVAGTGDVVGPASATDGNLAVFDGATGKLLKDGGAPGGGSVSDAAYGVAWNGDTTTAPSKNAVYDKIETLAPASHDHTGSSDGGVLTGDIHDSYSELIEVATPSNPAADRGRLFTRANGSNIELVFLSSQGLECIICTLADNTVTAELQLNWVE